MSTTSPLAATQLAALLGRLPHAVAVFDAALRLVYANDRWPAFSGDAEGSFPREDDLRAAATSCLTAAETHQFTGWRAPSGDADGCWDITLAPLGDALPGAGLICVAEDVSARVRAERAAASSARLAAFRADVSQVLARSDDADTVLQACAELIVRHAPAAFARVWVLDEAEDSYRLRASAGLYTRLDGTYARIPAAWVRNNTFTSDVPALQRDIQLSHRVRELDWATEQGLVAWASHPLLVRGRVIGFMVLFARQNLDDEILDELGAVADAIAQFLERARAEAALREREQLFRSVFESAADGLLITDLESGQVLEANPAFHALLGYERGELVARGRGDLVVGESARALADYVAAVDAGGAAEARLRARRRDGSTVPVDARGTRILYGGRPALLGVVRDITREVEAQEELERRVVERTRELSLLLDITREVAGTLELQPLLELILDQLRAVIPYTGTAVLTCEGDDLVIAGQRGPLSDEQARHARYPIRALAPIWPRLLDGEAVAVPDVRAATPEARAFRQAVGTNGDIDHSFIGSCLWTPLLVKGELMGMLSITSDETSAFAPHQIAMAQAIARQAAVAIENARLHEQARAVAALEERQRLARELHDSVSQALFGIGLGAETARAMLDQDPARAIPPIEYVQQLAKGGMAEMRALIFELRPESLEQEGLVAALQKQAAATHARHDIAVTLELAEEPRLPLAVKEALYRIAQEALHNTVKHAEASTVVVRLAEDADGLTLDVIDDGRGFDAGGSFPGHLGLVSMRERIARVGGTVTIASAPGEGTRVRVRLPPADDHETTEE